MRLGPAKSTDPARRRVPRRNGLTALWLLILWTVWGLHAPFAVLATPANAQPVRVGTGSPPLAVLVPRTGTDPIDTRAGRAHRNGAPGFDPDRPRGPEEGTGPVCIPFPTVPPVSHEGLTPRAVAGHIGSECARRGMRTAGRDPPRRG